MIRKFPFIQILTAMYILCIAVYMIYNNTDNKENADFWKNYYWIVNKAAMLMAISFNYKKEKNRVDWLTINFLLIQTSIILIYFAVGLPFFYEWMKMNDAVIYSFFIGSFLALCLMWFKSIRGAKE